MLYSRPRSQQPTKRSYLPFIIVAVVLLLIVLGLFFYGTDHLPFWQRTSQPAVIHTTANNNTKGEPPTKTQSDQTTTQSEDNAKNDTNPTAGALIEPTGNFVSAHHVQASTPVTSTCITTPGASCQINFTKDGVTKSLPAETTDAGGNAYWNNWQPQYYGLATGTWTVTAVATLGTQTLSATDATPFEVTL